MPTQHKLIPDADLHTCKGAAAAAVGTVNTADGTGGTTYSKVVNTSLSGVTVVPAAGYFLVADGAGGFAFVPAAHGSTYFTNFTTPYTLAATTAYQKVAATTTPDGSPVAFTEGTNTSLTYTGTSAIHLDIVMQADFDQSTGSNKDIFLALYKNGVLVTGSETVVTTTSGSKVPSSMHRDVHAAPGDVFEMYCKISAAASVNFYTINLMASVAGA